MTIKIMNMNDNAVMQSPAGVLIIIRTRTRGEK